MYIIKRDGGWGKKGGFGGGGGGRGERGNALLQHL